MSSRKRELQFADLLTWERDKNKKAWLPFSAWHTLPSTDQMDWWVGWASARA